MVKQTTLIETMDDFYDVWEDINLAEPIERKAEYHEKL